MSLANAAQNMSNVNVRCVCVEGYGQPPSRCHLMPAPFSFIAQGATRLFRMAVAELQSVYGDMRFLDKLNLSEDDNDVRCACGPVRRERVCVWAAPG